MRDGPGARWCGCRPRGCSSRKSGRCRWPGACGSARSRRISGGGAGGPGRGRAGGEAARASRGPGGDRCRLSPAQLAKLQAALDGGPAAWGWDEDQRWTLARVTTLIGRLFHLRYTLRGTSYLLHRIGWTPQVPVHRAMERDEAAVTAWRAVTWAKVRG